MTIRRKRILVIALLIPLTLAFHIYSHIWRIELGQSNLMRYILSDLCYIPIFIAAIWFGIRGAILTTTVIAAISLIVMVQFPPGNPSELKSDYVEIIFFYIVGGVTGIVLDKDRKLHLILEKTQQHAAAYNRSLIEAGLDPMVTIGHDGKITDVNEASEKATGRNRGELIGTDFSDYIAEPEKARAAYLMVFKEGNVRDYPLEIKHRDGHATPVLYNASLYRDENYRTIGIIASARDITERRKSEEEVNRYITELTRANEELQRFAYVASHDLQEPLRMISSYLQLLEMRYKDKLDQDANDFIEFAVGGARRLQNMILSLLEYSRINTSRNPLQPVSMNDILDDALNNLKLAIKENDAQIGRDKLPVVMGDFYQLSRVFSNLISNSIKFKGPDKPIIHIGANLKNGQWLFSVQDNGMGIDPKYHERVFVIFQRLHGFEYPGTGIGLSVAKRIVERHGGQMRLESEPGKGATFFFTLSPANLHQKIDLINAEANQQIQST
jgi:PAS domain S-box-containing protein